MYLSEKWDHCSECGRGAVGLAGTDVKQKAPEQHDPQFARAEHRAVVITAHIFIIRSINVASPPPLPQPLSQLALGA